MIAMGRSTPGKRTRKQKKSSAKEQPPPSPPESSCPVFNPAARPALVLSLPLPYPSSLTRQHPVNPPHALSSLLSLSLLSLPFFLPLPFSPFLWKRKRGYSLLCSPPPAPLPLPLPTPSSGGVE
eukprot:Sspe_Gene.16296::Locus_5741_Transcript_1_1_Confidence_1.000_Length_900::g.16296::m.16296